MVPFPTRSVAAGFGRHGMPPPAGALHWSHDLATLTFDLGGHGACGCSGSLSSICVPNLKFVALAVRKMCVSINGPGDLDIWPFDLETGVQVASKMGNLRSEFGHARPSGSPVIRYVRDGRTDKTNACCPLSYGRGIIILNNLVLLAVFCLWSGRNLRTPIKSRCGVSKYTVLSLSDCNYSLNPLSQTRID